MPVYEYECLKCGGRVEELQKFSDPPPKKHTGCGGKLKRLVSAPAIQFKGSGWYITDYARAGNGDKDKKKEAKEGGESKAETKTEAKKEDSSSKPAKDTKTKK